MVASESSPMFLKSVDYLGEIKDKHFIANFLKEIIDEVGHENIVQIITDNAKNCKGTEKLLKVCFLKYIGLLKYINLHS